ncbi:SAM-dependent methyltransferase [Actinocorallia sp. A-T 12471]|uniref:SAM-dependent methyltransferase n=1 Tax=Actinocorallia sp. A-T 12471 TaxID=3089813 RepID=UPI0029D014B3|nr:SAM-dependent methyltransferase [Actinocorallia sp. A-T 12471]MDX6740445.1 SAM-dependent methyltransferase [Actinocorallia sp. A-T 12471]
MQRPLPASRHIDTSVSHSARIWDYWLGGTENYPVDRVLGDQIAATLPDIVEQARADRAFLGRVVRFAVERGIEQFLDVGAGLPTASNTHEVAQRLAPKARVVYVDNDPLVLAHARALLTSSPEGKTAYLDADMHDPSAILERAGETLDFASPVAVTMLGVLWHVLEDDEALDIVRMLMSQLAPGSLLAIAHPTIEVTGSKMDDAIQQWNLFGKPEGRWRSPEQLAALFADLELVQPGIISCPLWRPDVGADIEPIDQYCGVGLIPEV